MAWFAVPVAIAGVGYAAKKFNENRIITCSCCGKQSKNRNFEHYEFMGSREEHFANYWLHKRAPLCKKCGQLIEEAYKIVLKKMDDVETYPIGDKGKKYEERIAGLVPITLDSEGASEEEALAELKINAILHQSDTVIDIYYDDRSYDGPYPYTRYIAKGTAYVPEKTANSQRIFTGPESLREFIRKNSN